MKKKIKVIAASVTAAVLFCGCSRTPVSGTTEAVAESGISQAEIPEQNQDPQKPVQADEDRIRQLLGVITAEDRSSGSPGETKTAEFMYDYFQDLGYEITLQPFAQSGVTPEQPEVTGTNVIARMASQVDPGQAGILIISAHHDAKPGIQGACDNASGAAVMMEAARLVADLDSDIEVRFLSFAGEENGRVGSRYYVEQMTDQEKERVIGDLQLDELGYLNSEYLVLSTVDGKPVWLGDQLSEKAAVTRNVGRLIPYQIGFMSDHNSFSSHEMPAVMLSQDTSAFENHTTQDTVALLDMRKLSQTAQLVADVAADLMGGQAHQAAPVPPGFAVRKETQLYFGKDRNFVENMMALTGTPVSTEQNEYGDTVERYRYPIRWFNKEHAIGTLFEYRNGYLDMIEIPMQEAGGQSLEETKVMMTAALGEPEMYDAGTGDEYGWSDAAFHKYYSLVPSGDDEYQLLVMDYSIGKVIQTQYDLEKGIKAVAVENPRDEKLLSLVAQIVHPQDIPLIYFSVYSDGTGNSTGYSGPITYDDNSRMEYALDETDALNEQGEWTDYHKTVKTAVHEYGHVISLHSGQVDITEDDSSMPKLMYETETYGKDAYLRAYYEEFWKDADVKSGAAAYEKNPTDFVSYYGATNLTEDFAESFMLFVLSNRPEDDTKASRKIRFFYGYEEMVMRREFIRSNLNLSEETKTDI